MGALQRSEDQPPEEFPPHLPPLRVAMWLRFGVTALTLAAILALWVLAFGELEHSEFAGLAIVFLLPILSAILFVCFALPSFVIAVGLLRASHAAIGLAIIHDLLILVFSIYRIIKIISSLRLPYGPGYVWEPLGALMRSAPWVVLGLAFAAEGAYLLRRAWKWRLAWPVFALLAAGMLAAVTIIPHVLWAPLARDMQPLLTYVNAHWVKIPPGARVALGQWSTTQDTHTDHIVIRGENASWRLSAEHRPDGRWAFPGTHRSTPTFMGMPSPSTEQRRVTSLDEARMLLLDCDVVDTDLHLERAVTQEFEFSDRPAYGFWFWSPLAQGRYRVYCDNLVRPIEFYLEQPLEVP